MTIFALICFALVFLIIVGWLITLFIALTGGWGLLLLLLITVGVIALKCA